MKNDCPECDSVTGHLKEICRCERTDMSLQMQNAYRKKLWNLEPRSRATVIVSHDQIDIPSQRMREQSLASAYACRYRGEKLREDKSNLCGSVGKQTSVFACSKHGECSLSRYCQKQTVKTCSGCNDIAPPLLRKHLLFHLLPVAEYGGWVWRKHAMKLRNILPRFDGRKIIAIPTPGRDDRFHAHHGRRRFTLDSPETVQDAIGQDLGVEYITVTNRGGGESATFPKMLEMLQTENDHDVFFYGHAKGVSHGHEPVEHPAHLWTDMLWETVAENQDQALAALETASCAGSFTMHGHMGHRWRGKPGAFLYAGTYFWCNVGDVFSSTDWVNVPPYYGGVELWPGFQFSKEQSACLFCDSTKDDSPWPYNSPKGCLYIPDYLRERVIPRLEQWRSDGKPFDPASTPKSRDVMPETPAKTTWFYRSYQDMINDVHAWCDRLPQISAVCGIPRSGIAPASIIAARRNIPLLSYDALVSGQHSHRRPGRAIRDVSGPILLVDDTSWSGNCMREHKEKLRGQSILCGAVYAKRQPKMAVDTWAVELPTPYHTFEWNFLREGLAVNYVCDLDGVFRRDWVEFPGCEETRPMEYQDWLVNGKPTHLVSPYQVRAICSGSLSRYRHLTEEWLRKNGVKYGELVLPCDDIQQRFPLIVEKKAETYQRHKSATLFVESEIGQAKEIYRLTNRPVFCTDQMRIIQ